MWGAIIGAATQVASMAASSILQKKQAKQRERDLDKQRDESRRWFDLQYNQDPLQRADSQRLLNKTMEAIRDRNREAEATKAVVGGTEESVAATKAANAKALSDTMGSIAEANERRKENAVNTYRNEQSGFDQQQLQSSLQKSNNIAEAMKQIGSAVGTIGGAIDGAGGLKADSSTEKGSDSKDEKEKGKGDAKS